MRDEIASTWSIVAVLILFLTVASFFPSETWSNDDTPKSIASNIQMNTAQSENCSWLSKLNPFG